MSTTTSYRKTVRRILLAAVFLIVGTSAYAQKYAYVDSQYILDNISEYKAANTQLDQISIQWQKEIEDKYSAIDKLNKAYQAEQILLTEEMKRKRQDEISSKEKDVKDLQKQRFGYEGDLFKKKQELVKPIQDKIFNAIKKFADNAGYAVIFDKAGSTTMLYTNSKFDKSDEILQSMGYKAGVKKDAAGDKGTGGQKEPTPGSLPNRK
jgi:outer membrane protein